MNQNSVEKTTQSQPAVTSSVTLESQRMSHDDVKLESQRMSRDDVTQKTLWEPWYYLYPEPKGSGLKAPPGQASSTKNKKKKKKTFGARWRVTHELRHSLDYPLLGTWINADAVRKVVARMTPLEKWHYSKVTDPAYRKRAKKRALTNARVRFFRARQRLGILTPQDLDDFLHTHHVLTPEFKFLYGKPLTDSERLKLGLNVADTLSEEQRLEIRRHQACERKRRQRERDRDELVRLRKLCEESRASLAELEDESPLRILVRRAAHRKALEDQARLKLLPPAPDLKLLPGVTDLQKVTLAESS